MSLSAMVVGAGAVSPWGTGLPQAAPIPPSATSIRRGAEGEWKDEFRRFWPEAPARAGRMDRACRMCLLAARECLLSSGLVSSQWEEAGIVVGSRFSCLSSNDAFDRDLTAKGASLASPLLFSYTVAGAAAGEVSIAFSLRGPTLTVCAGDASGLAAMREGIRLIRRRRASRVLVGAFESLSLEAMEELGGRDGEGRLPFDGALFLLLEGEEEALSRGASRAMGVEVSPLSFDPHAEDGMTGPPGTEPSRWSGSVSPLLSLARSWYAGLPCREAVQHGPYRQEVALFAGGW